MSELSTFECWQLINMTAQSFLLLAAFLGAFYVGMKQYQINKQLVELQHQPSVEVAVADEQLQVLNKGTSSIWLWGTDLEHSQKSIEEKPRLITPSGFYYIPIERLKRSSLERIGPNGEEHLSLSIFIKTTDDRKYVIRNNVFCKAQEGNVSVHSQTIAVDNEEWTS